MSTGLPRLSSKDSSPCKAHSASVTAVGGLGLRGLGFRAGSLGSGADRGV